MGLMEKSQLAGSQGQLDNSPAEATSGIPIATAPESLDVLGTMPKQAGCGIVQNEPKADGPSATIKAVANGPIETPHLPVGEMLEFAEVATVSSVHNENAPIYAGPAAHQLTVANKNQLGKSGLRSHVLSLGFGQHGLRNPLDLELL